ncbi:tRNA wybutosine-synthesizing protein 2 homolog isoform X4 [Hydra vulgaris]|uniref:tRNA(Phe) (4-demethylwyosine(37)-C(7)) aminocarboxypropyltransferase n=1 Tax=Hydra vulgaris TaxID=6087 RepID=A0ABM4D2W9_HYDVU
MNIYKRKKMIHENNIEDNIVSICCLMVEKKNAKSVKNICDKENLLHKDFRLTQIKNLVAIPLSFESTLININDLLKDTSSFHMQFVDNNTLLKSKIKNPSEQLVELCYQYSLKLDGLPFDELKKNLPKRWEIHGNLILFPDHSFSLKTWEILPQDFWIRVAKVFNAERIAIKSKIIGDGFRTPNVILRLGNDSWVEHIDNGIKYAYDVRLNMFSKGNITEKLRISSFNCENEVVVDLFAGIGYFTLPYLVKARAHTVYACEWNPNAIIALKRNLEINGVNDRCIVIEGDNRKNAPRNVADRVNLGLIPTSQMSWKAACDALKIDSGGVLHVHENVTCKDDTSICSCSNLCLVYLKYNGQVNNSKRISWCTHLHYCMSEIRKFLPSMFSWNISVSHIEYVKSYAPHVDHLVFDLLVSRKSS